MAQAVQDLFHEIAVAVQQLTGGEVHGRGPPRTTLVRMRDGGLLGRRADQLFDVAVVAQRHRNAAHHGAVACRAVGGCSASEAAGIERLAALLDQSQRAPRGRPDPATARVHPAHPARGDVGGVEIPLRQQGLRQVERHGRVVVEWGTRGRGGEVAHAAGERLADRLRRAHTLRGHTELVAGHEPE